MSKSLRMNHLFFIVDDLNLALGCYGHPVAHTPNIDRLAARGVRFANAYCPYPLCGPSRTAILTGQRPESYPMPDNEVSWRDLAPNIRTLPQIFREAGYHTAGFGKIFHHGISQNDLAAWRANHPEERLAHSYNDAPSWTISGKSEKPSLTESQATGVETIIDGQPHGGTSLHTIRATNPEALPDYRTARLAINFLQEASSGAGNFFLGVGFNKPHVPFIAPERWWAYYDNLEMEALQPPTWFQPATLPHGTFKQDRFHRGMNEEQRRHCYQGYLACVSWMDEQVGRVLAALHSNGLSDTTLVTFVADHGYHIGEHAQWDKMQLLDPALRVPLILTGPGIPQGQTATATVESLDLFATITEMHGIDPAQPTAGKSLRPFLINPSTPTVLPAYAWVHAGPRQGWTIRTDRFRYGLTSWENGPLLPYMFDYDSDPYETTNLLAGGIPNDWSDIVVELDSALRTHYKLPLASA